MDVGLMLMNKKLATFPVKRILVAVDGSTYSNKAVALAVELAKKWNPKIYVIHVLEESNVPMEFVEFAKDEGISVLDYFGRVCSQIISAAEAVFKEAGIKKVETICPSGNPADEIIKAAEKKKVDLIIMGNRGKGGFSKAIMGGVSNKVCNHANSTCITVK